MNPTSFFLPEIDFYLPYMHAFGNAYIFDKKKETNLAKNTWRHNIYTNSVDSKLTPVKQIGHHLTLNSKITNVLQRNVSKISIYVQDLIILNQQFT
jgi:hypothetical protein